jgi:chromosome segregation ATPase
VQSQQSQQPQQPEQPQADRVQQLEQALDQALACLADLRLRLQDQQHLENQLAETESYASVQQQAIVRLKLQISEQQQALEIQRLETQQRDQAIQELLATIESMAHSQQQEGERLRSRLAQDQQQVQSHRSRLGKHLQGLQTVLESRQQRLLELVAETQAARGLSARLQHQLEDAQRQIQVLSRRFEPELLGTATFRSDRSELSWQLDPENLPPRLGQLEQQIAEMQEQILQQAQQETEYETAVQYWKDRYLSQQQQLKRSALSSTAQPLNGWPDHLPDELPDDVPIAHPATENSSDESLPAPRLPTVDLPEFLVRRRASKADLPARVR